MLVTNLINNYTVTAGTFWTTASISPLPYALILISITAVTNTDVQPATPTVTGNGITYALINKVDYDNSSSSRRTVFIFRGMSSAPTAGAVTIDYGAQTILRGTWSVEQVTGVDLSGSNGSGAIVQSATADNGIANNECTVTLSAFGSSDNATYGAFSETSKESATADTDFVLLCNNYNTDSLSTQFKYGTDTTVKMTWVNTVDAGGVAIEIKRSTAIAYSNKSVSASEAGISSITYAHNTGTLVRGCLVVGVAARDGGSTDYVVSGIAFNGDALTYDIRENYTDRTINSESWHMVNPDAGSFNVVVTFAGTVSWARSSATSWSNVDQSTPIDSTDANQAGWEAESTASLTHTTIVDNCVIIDVGYDKNLALTVGAGQVELYNLGVQSDDDTYFSSYERTTTAGDYVIDWGGGSSPGEDWTFTSLALKPYVASGAIVKDVVMAGIIPFAR